MKLQWVQGSALCFVACLVLPSESSAFCRQKTCDGEDCPIDASGCVAEGDDLFYARPCLSFAVDGGSGQPLGLSDAALEEIVAQAFQAWQQVECPAGGNPRFEVRSLGAVPADGIFFCEEETLNASVWTMAEPWPYDATSLGYTTSTFVVSTGEVFDADVELNLGRIRAVVPAGDDPTPALLSVATHEAGHFLGLAHSDRPTAVMAASYRDLRPRALTDDDIAGICALYPPSSSALVCGTPGVTEAAYDPQACDAALGMADDPEGGACSVRVRRSNGGSVASSWLALLSSLGVWYRRRLCPRAQA